jgi:hypothetical protein
MSNDLVVPEDLAGFPGAPFADAVVDAAVAELRKAAGWHIAPSRQETVAVESEGGWTVILPTLHLTEVRAARDVTSLDADPTVLTGWRGTATLRFRAGIVGRPMCGWPRGALEVDITHGYDRCPPELLPVIAAACRSMASDARTVQSENSGPFSVTYRAPSGDLDPAVARYALPSRP